MVPKIQSGQSALEWLRSVFGLISMRALRIVVVSVFASFIAASLASCAGPNAGSQKPVNPRDMSRTRPTAPAPAEKALTSPPAAANPTTDGEELAADQADLPITPPLQNPFIPVNMSINPGDWVTQVEAGTLEYLRDRVASSGLFGAVAPGVQRWPVTLELRFEHKPQSVVADTAAGIVAGGTLFLVPSGSVHDYVLKADLWTGYQAIERREYKIARTRKIWLFKSPYKIDHPAIDQLIELMKADFVARPPLPTLRETQQKPVAQKPSL